MANKSITIQKIGKDWVVGYFGSDNINHYLEEGKTKEELIKNLAQKLLEQKENDK